MRGCFYTYGDPQLGMGHIYRCLALAKIAQQEFNWSAEFALKDHAEGLSVVAEHGFPFTVWHDDDTPEGNWDFIIVDQLRIDPAEAGKLKSCCRLLASLDDTGPGHYAADLAFNGLYKCQFPIPRASTTQIWEGLEYLVIDPIFSEQNYTVRETIKDVLLTQGGADTYGRVHQLIGLLSPWFAIRPGTTLHVHTGPAYKFMPELENAIGALANPVRCHQRVGDMAAFMCQMDVAISAIGIMACELAAVGVPAVLVTAEKKELETAAIFESKEMAIVLGKYTDDLGDPLTQAMDRLEGDVDLRKQLSWTARCNIDGAGAQRILTKIAEQF